MTIFVNVTQPPYRVSFERNGERHEREFNNLEDATKYVNAIKMFDLEERISALEKKAT